MHLSVPPCVFSVAAWDLEEERNTLPWLKSQVTLTKYSVPKGWVCHGPASLGAAAVKAVGLLHNSPGALVTDGSHADAPIHSLPAWLCDLG